MYLDTSCDRCRAEMDFVRPAGQGGIYSCPNGCYGNKNVYINHCCECDDTIDSRYCERDQATRLCYCNTCGALCAYDDYEQR